MWRLLKLYHTLKKGPHGDAVTGITVGSALIVCFLVAGSAYAQLWVPVVAISLGGLFAVLILIIVLLNRLRAKLNDVHSAISLEVGLQRAGWTLTDFFTDEAAANPSLQLFNLKVLRFCQPTKALELGSGQTTKLLSAYASTKPSVYVLTLEQDESWVQRLRTHIAHDYRYVPLERKEFPAVARGCALSPCGIRIYLNCIVTSSITFWWTVPIQARAALLILNIPVLGSYNTCRQF